MIKDINHQELVSACYTLFGPLFHFSEKSLDYIQTSGIKSAYREKAKLYHPDRSTIIGESKDYLAARFNELTNAYKLLLDCIKNPVQISFSSTVKNYNYYKKNDKKDFYYSGAIPNRRLRFGEYLYYSKVISWNTLISAIVAQYKKRPRLGELAVKLNYLDFERVTSIIKEVSYLEKFGEAAVRVGLLNTKQLENILNIQKGYNMPIGRFFIDENILTKDELISHFVNFNKYNNSIKNCA